MTSSVKGLGTKQRRQQLPPLIPIVSILLLLLSLGLFAVQLVSYSRLQTRLPTNLRVAGIDVSGLEEADAVSRWVLAYAEPVTLFVGESPIILNPAEIGFRTNDAIMIAQAKQSNANSQGFWQGFLVHLTGREFNQAVDIPLNATYQETLLVNFLQDIANRYNQKAGGARYNVDTLEVYSGADGLQVEVQQAKRLVEEAIYRTDNRVVDLPLTSLATIDASIDTLRDLVVDYLEQNDFIYDGSTTTASVYILDLQTGEEVNLLGDVAFSAASTMKVAILIQYFRRLNFAPSQDEAWLMANSLLCSNNASSNLLAQIIGDNDLFAGLRRINDTLQEIGTRNTYLTAPFDLGIAGQQLGSIGAPVTYPNANHNTGADPYNRTSAEDMGYLYTMLYDCAEYGSGLALVDDEGFLQNECKQMLELMSANDLLRLLQGGIPEGVRISHKNGWIFDTVGDAGIVYSPNGRNYVIAVYLWEQTDFQDFERLWPLVEGISRATWNYFNPEATLTEPRADLPFTAQECEGNYLPPSPEEVNLDDIDAWKQN
jgi:beta-lactamase class A